MEKAAAAVAPAPGRSDARRAWRAAWLHYRGGKPLGLIGLAALALFAFGMRTLAATGGAAATAFFWAAILLPPALLSGVVSRDRRASRWIMLFQAPVAPRAHYLRILALGLAALLALLLMGALLMSATAVLVAIPLGPLWGGVAAAAISGGVIGLTAFGVSALLPRYDGAVLVLLLLASFFQVSLLDAVGIARTSAAARAVSRALVPLDSLAAVWQGLTGAATGAASGDIVRIAMYGGVWFVAAVVALERLGRREAPLRDD